MAIAKCIGRVGVLAVALGVAAASARASTPTVSPNVKLTGDSTALVVCGLGCPTPDAYFVDSMMNQFVTPTHPGQTLTPVGVTGPTDSFPILGILRLIVTLTGDPNVVQNLWPDEPWWKLTGLFDRTSDQSVAVGVSDLEAAMAEHGNDHLVIAGESGGAAVAVAEKRKLAAQYPQGTTAPDISFVLTGDPSVPNGGLNSRFPGLPTFFLGTFTSAEPTDTQFHTDVIIRQYDGAADFPLYPLNIVADLNAVLGFLYVHTYPFDVGLPADPATSPAYQGTHGDSSYYFFPTDDLPLFAPLRQLGVPEGLIDVVEPVFRVLVEMGYDRSIPAWEPTPARLIPTLDPVKVVTDLADAVGEGVNNAVALVTDPSKLIPTIPPPIVANVATLVSTLQIVAARQTPTTTVSPSKPAAGEPPSSTSAPVTLAAPAGNSGEAEVSPSVESTGTQSRVERVKSREPAPKGGRMSTDRASSTRDATETVKKTERAAVRVPEPSDGDAKPETPKPVLKPLEPRHAVRDSLDVGKKIRDPLRPVDRGRHNNEADIKTASGESPSTATSSARSSAGDGALGADSGGS